MTLVIKEAEQRTGWVAGSGKQAERLSDRVNGQGSGRVAGRGKSRIPELDGLRVLMIFIVSWFHIWQQSWLMPEIRIDGLGIRYSLDYLVRSGYVWVDGTVLLSVFLLFLPWARAKKEGKPLPDTRDFYYRRARRVLPGYYFILLAVFFGICLPWGLYYSAPYMVKDLAMHFTFTFPFSQDTYTATPLGAASWTLAILVQGYLLFPLIARGMVRKPVLTVAVLLAACFGFRAWCLWALDDYTMVVNRLLNFLDVYVIGMLGAMAYLRLEDVLGEQRKQEKGLLPLRQEEVPAEQGKQEESRMLLRQEESFGEQGKSEKGRLQQDKVPAERGKSEKGRLMLQLAVTLLFFVFFWGLLRLAREQARRPDHAAIQYSQMVLRPAFALAFLGLILTAPFCVKPLRFLLGNPVMRFLSGVSMNYYLIHQTVIVHMKRISFPPSVSEMPNMAGEQPWQTQYTLLSFGISLLLAVIVTYGVEKPAAKLIDRLRKKINTRNSLEKPAEQEPAR